MDASPSPAGTEPGSPSSYDVFVSYSHKDQEWVQSYLVPRLRAEGVRVLVDSDDFAIGEYSAVSMETAVVNSRFVLAVLTPDWVRSRWTAFESLLALTEGRKLLPLLLEPSELPLRIRALTYADFTVPSQREEELAKLLRAIAATAPASGPVQGEPVRRGLVALEDLMQEPEVRDALVASGIHLKRVCDRIGTVGGYKKVHDLLHTLQLHVYDRVLQEAKRFPDDELAAENLREHETTLRSTIADLGRIVEQALVPAGELAWVGRDLEPALAALGTALETREPKSLQRTVSLLKRVLTTRPSEINTRLNDVARDLPLAELTAEMAVVLERMRTLQLDQDKVEVFAGGMDAFTRLGQALAGLVADHDRWQVAEQELRLTEETWDGTADGVEESWTQARSTLQPMFASAEPWAAPLRQQAERMDAAVAAKDLDRARLCFRSVRREASTRFHQVDVLLMDQCDELDKVADPLTSLLERIES